VQRSRILEMRAEAISNLDNKRKKMQASSLASPDLFELLNDHFLHFRLSQQASNYLKNKIFEFLAFSRDCWHPSQRTNLTVQEVVLIQFCMNRN
jgi:hypothetical protein